MWGRKEAERGGVVEEGEGERVLNREGVRNVCCVNGAVCRAEEGIVRGITSDKGTKASLVKEGMIGLIHFSLYPSVISMPKFNHIPHGPTIMVGHVLNGRDALT